MLECQGDAPACEVCGTITVRNEASDTDSDDTSPERETELRLLTGSEDDETVEAARVEVEQEMVEVANAASRGDDVAVAQQTERIVHRPMRRRLPDTRQSLTHKFNIAGHEGSWSSEAGSVGSWD